MTAAVSPFRWLMKFDVEGDVGLGPAVPSLVFRDPMARYEVHLRSREANLAPSVAALEACILFDGNDLEINAAADRGMDYAGRFVDFLSFATGCRFTARRVSIYEWRMGVTSRRGILFQRVAIPDQPHPVLTDTIVSTVEQLLQAQDHGEVLRALRWFRRGMAATHRDDQFQMFWFAIETLAVAFRDKTTVPDQCAKCREPLFCRQCNEVPQHRPYPHQAIRALFVRYVDDTPNETYAAASRLRNAMLHGDATAELEASLSITTSELTDHVGRLAWTALLDSLARTAPTPVRWQLQLIQRESFQPRQSHLEAAVVMSRPCRLDEAPQFDEFPPKGFEVELTAVPAPPHEPTSEPSPYVMRDDGKHE